MPTNLSIRDGMENIEAELRVHPYSASLQNLRQDLRELREEYGMDCVGPWQVVATRFHGGGVISAHRSILAAARAARKWKISDCTCGCCGVVPVAKELPGTECNNSNGYSPYSITR